MPADDLAKEIAALHRRYPRWSIWFGLATGHWWALPPADRDIGDFVEAPTPQKLIARIEVIQQTARTDSRQGIGRPSASLHLEGVPTTPLRRVPAAAWPGSTSR
ncbi:MAG TPA: hypothetical protein VF069_09855 [Streptosporangiaceae bacterium]